MKVPTFKGALCASVAVSLVLAVSATGATAVTPEPLTYGFEQNGINDTQFLELVHDQVSANPEQAEAIELRAKELRPDLSEQIEQVAQGAASGEALAASMPAASTGVPTAALAGGAVLVAGGVGAVAMSSGGGGSDDGGSKSDPKPSPEPQPGPKPEPKDPSPEEPGEEDPAPKDPTPEEPEEPTLPAPTPPQPKDYETSEYRNSGGLDAINASAAYARGFSGQGVTVAVMDTGVDVNHPDLKDRIVFPYDAVGDDTTIEFPDEHGTHVAGIIGASRNDKGMHGVAWSADIMPVSFSAADGSLDFGAGDANLVRGWEHAVNNGASVINNSWSVIGWHTGEPVLMRDYATLDELIDNEYFENIVEAAKNVADAGVVSVFSTGNDSSKQPNVVSGLPYYVEELEGYWIAVTSVDVNDGNKISHFANFCGDAAAWCLSAPGSAGSDGINSTVPGGGYEGMQGTSMAAPHVSGAVAVLMSAFPHLKPDEVVSILFETAQNIGDSSIYGHGLLDLERATRPVGAVSIPVAGSVDGRKMELSATSLHVSPAFGDGVVAALAGEQVLGLDAYNRGYQFDMASLVRSDSTTSAKDSLHRLKLFGGAEERSIHTLNSGPFSITTSTKLRADEPGLGYSGYSRMSFGFTTGGGTFEFSMNPDAGRSFGFRELGFANTPLVESSAFNQPHLGLMETGYGSSFGFNLSDASALRLGVFAGNVANNEDGERVRFGTAPKMTGAVAEMQTNIHDDAVLVASVGALNEEGSILGSVSKGAFGENVRSNTFFGNLGATVSLTERTRLTFAASLGQTSFKQDGIVESGSGILTTSFGAGISHQGIFYEDDAFSLAVSQPLRVEGGNLSLSVPSVRNMDGSVGYRSMSVSPQPTGREIALQAAYGFQPLEGVNVAVGGMHRINPGHMAGAPSETIGMATVSLKF